MYCEEYCCELKKYEHIMKDALAARYLSTPNHVILIHFRLEFVKLKNSSRGLTGEEDKLPKFGYVHIGVGLGRKWCSNLSIY